VIFMQFYSLIRLLPYILMTFLSHFHHLPNCLIPYCICIVLCPLLITVFYCLHCLYHCITLTIFKVSWVQVYFILAIWLILPVVICLSQILSHVCLSTNMLNTRKMMAF
jgi:hypothetical protein